MKNEKIRKAIVRAGLKHWEAADAIGISPYARVGVKPLLPANWRKAPNDTGDYIRAQVKKQADPTEKSGIVGAFCKVYDVHKAIAELIPGVYSPVDSADDRYTFVGGSTTGGAIVYEDGKFLFSHHATDPCGGRLVNAFDLVQLHKFGGKDDNAAPGTPVGRLPSYTNMREWVQTLPDVRIEAATAAADFAGLESAAGEDESWQQQLDTTQAGGLKNTLNNIVLILEHDARFKGKLRKNLLHERIEVQDLPWERSADGPWRDTDTGQLRIMLEQIMSGKVAENDVYTAFDIVADEKSSCK